MGFTKPRQDLGRTGVALVAALVAAVSLGACSGGGRAGNSPTTTTGGSSSPSATTPTAAPAAVVQISPPGGGSVNPLAPITVNATGGTLSSVTMTNGEGKRVTGTLSADKTSWKVGEVLGYAKSYRLTAQAVNRDGKATTKSSTFTTLTPNNMTMPYIDTTGGSLIQNGGTYGVGMVVAVHWDEPIPNRAAAEKSLTVTTSPHVQGSWYWMDNQNVHWRPAGYYQPGTTVKVTAHVYGVDMGGGLYGQADTTTSFRIGQSHVSIADDRTKLIHVYQNGKLVLTMPTSMGKGGSEVVNGQTITFWTQPGTYTVLDQANPVRMDSRSFGLPLNQGGYNTLVNWATRISTDGIYVHSAPWSVWAQGNTDTSHGCLNVSPNNAQWFYQWSQVGDVVQVQNTGGAPLQVWQNGDWSVPWSEWMKGSALH